MKISFKLEEIPEELRLNKGSEILKQLIRDYKKKTGKSLTKIKEEIGKGIIKNEKNFRMYLNNQRNAPFIIYKRLILKTNRKDTLQKILKEYTFKFGHGGNAASAKWPTTITEDLAYIAGALRDGTLARSGKYEISFNQKTKEWLTIIKKKMEDLFKPSNKFRIKYMKTNSYRLIISNRVIFEFLKLAFNLSPGNKKKWKTPRLILNTNLKIKKAYLQGFFDADGIAKTNGTLGFCQAIREPLQVIKNMLKSFGILCNPITKYKIYYLYIKKEFWPRFIEKIGSLNPQKYSKFIL